MISRRSADDTEKALLHEIVKAEALFPLLAGFLRLAGGFTGPFLDTFSSRSHADPIMPR